MARRNEMCQFSLLGLFTPPPRLGPSAPPLIILGLGHVFCNCLSLKCFSCWCLFVSCSSPHHPNFRSLSFFALFLPSVLSRLLCFSCAGISLHFIFLFRIIHRVVFPVLAPCYNRPSSFKARWPQRQPSPPPWCSRILQHLERETYKSYPSRICVAISSTLKAGCLPFYCHVSSRFLSTRPPLTSCTETISSCRTWKQTARELRSLFDVSPERCSNIQSWSRRYLLRNSSICIFTPLQYRSCYMLYICQHLWLSTLSAPFSSGSSFI